MLLIPPSPPISVSGTRESEFFRFNGTAQLQATTSKSCKTCTSPGSYIYTWFINAGTFSFACWYNKQYLQFNAF